MLAMTHLLLATNITIKTSYWVKYKALHFWICKGIIVSYEISWLKQQSV